MSTGLKNECIINGVSYKCRCCFDPGRRIYSLAEEANHEKTWRDLLKDVAQLQAEDDDLLPKTVCSKCLERLQSSHDFILQIHNVNKKYTQLLAGGNDPLQNGLLNDIESYNDCLAESAIALPLELPEIKLEEELSYDMNLSQNQQLQEDIAAKSEIEEDDDPFTHTFDDNPKSPTDELEENESANTLINEKSTKKRNRSKRAQQPEDAEDESSCSRKKRTRAKGVAKEPKETDKISSIEIRKSTCGGEEDDFLKLEGNKCPICGKEFRNKCYVAEHVKVVHEKVKPFKCSHCPKTFSSNHSKKSHELSHTDDFPFACEYCERRFRRSSKLKIHTEIHTTKPELLCPICKRGQKSAKDLEEHVKSHDDNRLQCPSCGRFFRRNSQLTDHYNAVHLKLRPYKCAFCELGFGDRKTRRMHERKYHPKDRPTPS